MAIHDFLAATSATLPGMLEFVTPAAPEVAAENAAASDYAMTAGRFWSMVGGLLGLTGVVLGGLARSRFADRAAATRRVAVTGLVTGSAGAVIGGLVVAAADGGPGSGSGIVGGYVALVVGLIALVLGGWAMRRSAAPSIG